LASNYTMTKKSLVHDDIYVKIVHTFDTKEEFEIWMELKKDEVIS